MRLNAFELKIIAIITMTIDHIGAVLFPQYLIFRYIGRLAFPIFAFFIVEGYYHTRDVKKYLGRLLAFALISEIPYDLAFHNVFFELAHQNVFFTLAIGLFLINLLENTGAFWIKGVWIIAFMWGADFLKVDYSYRGVALILIYYLLFERKWAKHLAGALWNIVFYTHQVPSLTVFPIQYAGAFATILLSLYNGERGPRIKYVFYVFYPAHLLIIYFIARILV